MSVEPPSPTTSPPPSLILPPPPPSQESPSGKPFSFVDDESSRSNEALNELNLIAFNLGTMSVVKHAPNLNLTETDLTMAFQSLNINGDNEESFLSCHENVFPPNEENLSLQFHTLNTFSENNKSPEENSNDCYYSFVHTQVAGCPQFLDCERNSTYSDVNIQTKSPPIKEDNIFSSDSSNASDLTAYSNKINVSTKNAVLNQTFVTDYFNYTKNNLSEGEKILTETITSKEENKVEVCAEEQTEAIYEENVQSNFCEKNSSMMVTEVLSTDQRFVMTDNLNCVQIAPLPGACEDLLSKTVNIGTEENINEESSTSLCTEENVVLLTSTETLDHKEFDNKVHIVPEDSNNLLLESENISSKSLQVEEVESSENKQNAGCVEDVQIKSPQMIEGQNKVNMVTEVSFTDQAFVRTDNLKCVQIAPLPEACEDLLLKTVNIGTEENINEDSSTFLCTEENVVLLTSAETLDQKESDNKVHIVPENSNNLLLESVNISSKSLQVEEVESFENKQNAGCVEDVQIKSPQIIDGQNKVNILEKKSSTNETTSIIQHLNENFEKGSLNNINSEESELDVCNQMEFKSLENFCTPRKSFLQFSESPFINYRSLLEESPCTFAEKMPKYEKQTDMLLKINELQQIIAKLEIKIKQKEYSIIKYEMEKCNVIQKCGSELSHTNSENKSDDCIHKQNLEKAYLKVAELEEKYIKDTKYWKSKLLQQEGESKKQADKIKQLETDLVKAKQLETDLGKVKQTNFEMLFEIERVTKDKQTAYDVLEKSDKIISNMANKIRELQEQVKIAEEKIKQMNEKYQFMKLLIKGLKENEEIYKKNIEQLETKGSKYSELYENFKSHALLQINEANKEIHRLQVQLEKSKHAKTAK